MKFFTIEMTRKDTLKGVLLRTPWFTFAIYPSVQSPEETIADKPFPTPLWQTPDGIANRTDPLLMDGQQRHENTVRMFMERKGYKRKEIDLPLTDERMGRIGRMTYGDYERFINRLRANHAKMYENQNPMGAVHSGQTVDIRCKENKAMTAVAPVLLERTCEGGKTYQVLMEDFKAGKYAPK
jgi:hypothetical protein